MTSNPSSSFNLPAKRLIVFAQDKGGIGKSFEYLQPAGRSPTQCLHGKQDPAASVRPRRHRD
jgi:hypothetical protein